MDSYKGPFSAKAFAMLTSVTKIRKCAVLPYTRKMLSLTGKTPIDEETDGSYGRAFPDLAVQNGGRYLTN